MSEFPLLQACVQEPALRCGGHQAVPPSPHTWAPREGQRQPGDRPGVGLPSVRKRHCRWAGQHGLHTLPPPRRAPWGTGGFARDTSAPRREDCGLAAAAPPLPLSSVLGVTSQQRRPQVTWGTTKHLVAQNFKIPKNFSGRQTRGHKFECSRPRTAVTGSGPSRVCLLGTHLVVSQPRTPCPERHPDHVQLQTHVRDGGGVGSRPNAVAGQRGRRMQPPAAPTATPAALLTLQGASQLSPGRRRRAKAAPSLSPQALSMGGRGALDSPLQTR